jgi:metal-sulfur cluster biosynthetic enzyme
MADLSIDKVRGALSRVIDPCSKMMGGMLSLADLGMVESLDITDDALVRVVLVLDDPICVYLHDIHCEIRDAILAVPGVRAVEIKTRGDLVWTEDRANAETRARLRVHREAARVRSLVLSPTRRRLQPPGRSPASGEANRDESSRSPNESEL